MTILLEHNIDILAIRDKDSTTLSPMLKYMASLKILVSKLQTSELELRPEDASIPNAILANSTLSVRLLLEYGLDVNMKDAGGKKPLDLALELANLEILENLLDFHAEAGLKWDHASVFIQKWSNEIWFHTLLSQLTPGTAQGLCGTFLFRNRKLR